MPHVTISEETFRRLASRAAALNISVDDFVRPTLEQLAETGNWAAPPEPSPPLTGAAWQAEFEAWKEGAERLADRYPPGFVVDDSREAIYRERGDAQL